jgi:uncharacterized protein YjbJ (UPF0337 family)
MNWDRIEGNWKQSRATIKEQWGKLTDDEFDMIAGKRDKLVARSRSATAARSDEADSPGPEVGRTDYETRPKH